MLCLTLFLLSLADLNDRQGLFSPASPNEPRHACIYTAKILPFASLALLVSIPQKIL